MGLRDMYSAISGLDANSTWLDVIGNNIANVNTIAYKASRVEFADQISQTLYGGTGDDPSVGLGGVDPQQVGLGTKVASITTLFTEGTLQQTGVSTDVAIVGNGFLVSKQGDNTYLTRAGNLTFDSTGNLVDQNGGLIQGLTASIQYTTKDIGLDQSDAAAPGAPNLNITSAKFGFATDAAAAAEDINIPSTMTEPPSATTMVNFSGNLDSFTQATDTQHGGVLNINQLPLGQYIADGGVMNVNGPFVAAAGPVAGEEVLEQQWDASQGALPNPNPAALGNDTTTNPNFWTEPMVGGGETLGAAQAAPAGTFVWDQQPPEPPAQQIVETVYDSEGNPRQVTVNFYQVNDLGDGGINNPQGPSQVAYAWYAFDTTNGAPVSTATLVGGTAIIEGQVGAAPGAGYNRGVADDAFAGDLLVFNTDGSLLSTGGDQIAGAIGGGTMSMPDIYLPPLNVPGAIPTAPVPVGGDNGPQAPASPLPSLGAQITQVTLNFGQAGILGKGERNGVYSDAEGSYQVINGVNTYVPNSTAYASSQNGYSEGQLQGVQFNASGIIEGTFSNGQTTAIAQVVMANPNNPDGLNSVGDNYFQASVNSGAMYVGFAGQEGMGTIQGDTLELSNVDLSVELSNMIIAQRGFEVNARVIAVESSDLQTLTQLGQGG